MQQQPFGQGQTGAQVSTGLPQVKGPEMNDRDRINDVLAMEKYICDGYNHATTEASNDTLFRTQMNLLNEVFQAHRDCFNLMHQKGWYKLEAASPQQVSQKARQFADYRTQFPY
ncbi:spore coat protein [Staphylospora marina]|uniref:spore coat protein n=1 Tax=Staphylospora marina TaxID=2490858 RepID=UPI000F5B9D62|nr:spore coat protein [Staphylospora marina]